MKYGFLASVIKGVLLGSVLVGAHAVADEQEIERIIVTGQKIDRELQETPTSVAVVTRAQIEEQKLVDMYDVLQQIPNVSGNLGDGFNIRGIDAFNVSGGGNSFLTSVYVDGAALPYRMIRQGAFSVWDVEQVEVLRGPQSTLQGRNALAGAIVMRTAQPEYEWGGKARLTIGEDGDQQLAAAVGGELVEDQVAFRLSGEKREADGENYNITRKEDSNFSEDQTYRLKLLIEPKALEGFSAVLSYTYNDSEIGVPWINGGLENPFDNRIVDFNDATFEFTENDIWNLEIDYELSPDWFLVAITTYTDSDYGYAWDGDAGPDPVSTIFDNRTDKTLSQEVRFIYEGEQLSAAIGGYYSNLDVEDNYYGGRGMYLRELGLEQILSAPPAQGGFGLDPATTAMVMSLYAPIDPVILGSTGGLTQDIESMAIYTDFNYEINDSWAVYGGLRYDREEQANSSASIVTIENANLLPDPNALPPVPGLSQLITGLNGFLMQQASNATGIAPETKTDFDAWLPKLGVSYFITDDMSTHFTYQRGYRSGGVGTNLAQNSTFTYDSEFTDNYELTYRSVWLDGDLVVNANAFFLDWSDMQVEVQLSNNSFDKETRNAGKAEVKGFELEMFYNPTDNWSFTAGVGQAKSEFKEFKDGDVDLSGKAFARAPEWTANVAATYRNEGWFGNINANYASSAYETLTPHRSGLPMDDPRYNPKNDARTVVNMRLGYEWDNFGIFANVENLLDEEYIVNADRGTGNQELSPSRHVSVSLTAKF